MRTSGGMLVVSASSKLRESGRLPPRRRCAQPSVSYCTLVLQRLPEVRLTRIRHRREGAETSQAQTPQSRTKAEALPAHPTKPSSTALFHLSPPRAQDTAFEALREWFCAGDQEPEDGFRPGEHVRIPRADAAAARASSNAHATEISR